MSVVAVIRRRTVAGLDARSRRNPCGLGATVVAALT